MQLPTPIEHRIKYPEGGVIALREWPADGPVVLHFHGVPASRIMGDLLAPAAARLGVRLITIDRPWFGETTAPMGPNVSDIRPLVRHAMDMCGIDEFYVSGHSGGGPYALAVAAGMPTRVPGVALISAAGFGTADERRWHRSSPRLSMGALWLGSKIPGMGNIVTRTSAMRWSRADRRSIDAFGLSALARTIPDTFRQGPLGCIRDLQRLVFNWGFAIADIDQPVQLWHAVDDPVCPLDLTLRTVAQLPDCEKHFMPGKAHMTCPMLWGDDVLSRLVRSHQATS